ncbi:hypothetical protein A3J90_05445 [candidate division WOR-1 bacterium RIFOXYC2_FULL_37_10]|uniref:Uncharacterized protein n=1 Tax=candidate division WOR-1 bacterium RIFOXYB2_FULL_37_13 TaxID=1802579 RepID=A0A1F4SX30_UNCSA|nr:MAG: hypothetical protein A2310_06785 [candidate division WOR-1 bacterium RIFOXYB2_FULL_37_13]OGC36478.1 MAG: hypothetical protein A3J90_05445 [candidate division WOR-1 bacterium RIFOXYC2_FULL_37_10]
MDIYLRNILWFCLIVLVVFLIWAVVEIIFILKDVRNTSKSVSDVVSEVKTKARSVASILDIAEYVKRALKVLFGGEKQ